MPDPDPIDANTRTFLRRVDRPLNVLSDPTTGPRPMADAGLLPLRTLAGHVRQHTVDHLDHYLATAVAAVGRAGGHVHWAADAAAARRSIADAVGPAATVVPSAVCDEVGWAAATDGGDAFVAAAAFVVAETGQVCLAGDDAAVAAAAAAPVLVCVAGIESVVPRSADLAVLLKLLSHAATGRPMADYTALVGGGGRTFHLVLLDNGRTDLLATEHRPLLRCIGCGACTAVCPVYRSAGVRPAGLWAGPIGAAAVPVVRDGLDDLPHASTLCGACGEVCPVRIDLPAHLIALRRRSPDRRRRLRWWAWVVLSPTRYRLATRWRRWRGAPVANWPRPAARSFQERWAGRERSR